MTINEEISDAEVAEIMAQHGLALDHLVDLYRRCKDKDAAEGVSSDEPALGALTMATSMLNRQGVDLILALAVRRLAEADRG